MFTGLSIRYEGRRKGQKCRGRVSQAKRMGGINSGKGKRSGLVSYVRRLEREAKRRWLSLGKE